MARRYDLGSVVGEIRFTYDKNGVLRARDDMGKFIKQTDDSGSSFDLFSKRGVSAAGKVAKSFGYVALAMAGVAGALNVVNGVVVALVQMSQAAALLPGAIAGFAAILGTVALGVDGIKKAFEGLKPTLDTLKKNVSASFESSLLPAVNHLKTLLPQLTSGFQQIATAIGGAATKFAAMLVEARSVSALNNILSQTAKMTQNVGAAAAPLGQAFLSIASIGISFITPMTAGLGNLAEQFNAWVQSAHGQAAINDMIMTGIQAFKTFFGIIGQLGGIVVAVFNGLSTSTGNFGSSLVDTLRAVKEFLQSAQGFNALQSIGQALQTVGDVVRTVLLTALEQIAPAIPPLMDAFSAWALQIMPPLVQILEIIGPIIVKIAQAIADNIQWVGPLTTAILLWAAAQWILNAALTANPIGLVITALALLAAAVALVITNWDTIAAFFKGIWDTVWKWTSDRITAIRDFIVNTWDGIVNWFSSLGDKIGSAFQSVLDFFGSVISWFSALPGKIINFLLGLPGQLMQLFLQAAQFMLNALVQGAEWLIAWGIALPIKIIQSLAAFGELLATWVRDSWNFLTTTLVQLGIELITWFALLPGRIVEAVSNFLVMLGTWFSDAWSSMSTLAAQKSIEFIAWITGLPGRIVQAVSQFIVDFATWIRDAFASMIRTAQQKASEFLSWLRGVPGAMLAFFTSLPGKMQSIGGDIVRGIWQGIQNLASWLWSKVTDFVGGIVDKVQSLLSIGSPSKVFADEVGRWIPAGIAQGIDNNASLVANSLQALFSSIKPNVQNIVSPLGKAAQEILNQLNSGGALFEDFSFNGNSDAVRQFNDQIAAMFYPSGGGKDFSSTSTGEIAGFLRNLISTQTTSAPQVMSTGTPTSSGQVTIQNLNVAGNLDPTNPTQWRQALVSIKDGIRGVERQYA